MYPVLSRELMTSLRSSKSFVVLFLFVLLLSAIVSISWPVGDVLKQASQSRKLFSLMSAILFVTISFIVPIFSATTISSEIENNCLEMLLVTPISTSQIVWQKLISSSLFFILLLIASYPILSSFYLMGGISFSEIIGIYFLTFSFAISFSTLAMLCSAYLLRTYAALSISYLIILPITLVVSWKIFHGKINLLVLVIMCFFLFLMAYFKIQKKLENPTALLKKYSDEKITSGLILDKETFPDNLLSPTKKNEYMPDKIPKKLGLKNDIFIPNNINLIYYKELYYEIFARGSLAVRLMIQLSLVLSLLFCFLSLRTIQFEIYFAFLFVFVIMISPSLAANAFTLEKENGTFDLLLTTPISANTMFMGKLMCSCRYQFTLLSFLFIPITPTFLARSISFVNVGIFLIFLIVFGIFINVICTATSLFSKTTLIAITRSYSIIVSLCILPLAWYSILNFTSLNEKYSWISMLSPFYTLFTMPKSDWITKCSYSFPSILFYLAGSVIVYAMSILLFDRVTRGPIKKATLSNKRYRFNE